MTEDLQAEPIRPSQTNTLMFKQLVPINATRHAKTRVREIKDFHFASEFHSAVVMVHEFPRAAAIYPLVFIEDPHKDSFMPVALLGLEQGKNLFVDQAGKWRASYIPAIVRRYPFALMGPDESGQFSIFLDEASALVGESDGKPLFDEMGRPSEAIDGVKRYLGELYQMEMFTRDFCRYLAEHNLFVPFTMHVTNAGERVNVAGCYVVNEDRLNNLSTERFLDLRAKRYLPGIYAHLVSLLQVERLVELKGGLGAL